MERAETSVRSKTVRIASSHIITTCATAAAILLFVVLGSRVVSSAIGGTSVPDASSTLSVAFMLNIAIIIFGWRRSKDINEALEAYDAGRGDFADYLIREHARVSGCEAVATFDGDLLKEPGFIAV